MEKMQNKQHIEFLHTFRNSFLQNLVIFLFGLLNVSLILSYFKTPLAGDVTFNLGSVKQTKFLGDWPISVITSWDLRGLVNKNLMYFLETFASNFSPTSIENYELFIKTLYFCLILIVLVWTIFLLKKILIQKIDKLLFIFLFFFTIFSSSNSFVALQADQSAAILGILLFALTANNQKKNLVIAGLLTPVTFGFKGITFLVGISSLFAGLALAAKKGDKNVKQLVISCASGILIYFFNIFFFARSELVDLANSTLYQQTFNYSFLGRLKISAGSILFQWPHVPIVILGLLFFAFLLVSSTKKLLRNKNDKNLTPIKFYFISLFFAILPIIIQAKGFGYHLTALVPFCLSIVTYILFPVTSSYAAKAWIFFLIICVFLSTPSKTGLWNNYVKFYAYQVETENELFKSNQNIRLKFYENFSSRIKQNCEKAILLLDLSGGYLIPNQSWLRYMAPLPLQRNSQALVDSTIRNDAIAKTLDFTGQCIVVDPKRFNRDLQPWLNEVYDKIQNEYYVSDTRIYYAFDELNQLILLRRFDK